MNVVLTIAGSDSSGGAGIQADLKTFEAFGLFGTSAITVLTAQNTQGVTDIFPVSASFVQAQLHAVLEDFDVKAIKIGMLFSNEIIDVVRAFIAPLNIPIVFDPVFISKAGSKLLNDDAIENMKSLLPFAALCTPNLFEAKALFGYDPAHKNINNLSTPVLVKHHVTANKSTDILFTCKESQEFSSPRLESENTHGTGCSYSSAIAANLALGHSLKESIEISKAFIYEAIKAAPHIGKGKGPIAHKKAGDACRTTC